MNFSAFSRCQARDVFGILVVLRRTAAVEGASVVPGFSAKSLYTAIPISSSRVAHGCRLQQSSGPPRPLIVEKLDGRQLDQYGQEALGTSPRLPQVGRAARER